jgi:iron complex transport system substrate-binding protein
MARRVASPYVRVVSLLPSATEMLFALGVEPVGVSHECDYPPAAADLPAVNASRVNPHADSASINQQVAEAEAEGGVYEIDGELLADLDPDLVVSQGVCDVCAVDASLVHETVERADLDADVLSTHPHSLGDVFDDVKRIGRAVGRPERAREVVADLRERVDAVEARVADADPQSLAVLDWMEPPMVAGHWVPELAGIAGATYPLADPGDRSTPREWRAVRDADPDVLVAAPCGFPVEQTVEHAGELADRPGWSDLAAVRDGRAYAMDGHHYLNRPGPRLVDSLTHLAALVHPDRFDPPGRGVRPLPGPGCRRDNE